MDYQIAKGVFDILPEDPDPEGKWREVFYWQYIEKVARQIAEEFGFQEIRTPLFERTELFTRSVGATSDIVNKEMYTFLDKGGRSLTLRPEGTASVMRAIIDKALYQKSSMMKFYYLLPMFRYERQQAGRYRQHHQFGIEAIGSASPYQDAEVIILLHEFLQRLGLKNLNLWINCLGDHSCRENFRQSLQNYLKPYFQELSPLSQLRFENNPLRILDSKDPKDQQILLKAPSILDFLEKEAQDDFEKICAILRTEQIPYQINPKLVRGLDYYNRTVFEITAEELGAQNSLGGGGRYDHLIHELGGPQLPAFGFGSGLERIIQTMLSQKGLFPPLSFVKVYLIPLDEQAMSFSFSLLTTLRNHHISAEMDLSGKKLKIAMKRADTLKAQYVIVIGEEELHTKQLKLKEMATGNSNLLPLSKIVEVLKK